MTVFNNACQLNTVLVTRIGLGLGVEVRDWVGVMGWGCGCYWVRVRNGARDRVGLNVGLKSVSNSNGNLLTLRLNAVIEFGTAVYRFAERAVACNYLFYSPNSYKVRNDATKYYTTNICHFRQQNTARKVHLYNYFNKKTYLLSDMLPVGVSVVTTTHQNGAHGNRSQQPNWSHDLCSVHGPCRSLA